MYFCFRSLGEWYPPLSLRWDTRSCLWGNRSLGIPSRFNVGFGIIHTSWGSRFPALGSHVLEKANPIGPLRALQRWLSMPLFSPPLPISGLCTGLRPSCSFDGGRALWSYNQRSQRGETTPLQEQTYSLSRLVYDIHTQHIKSCQRIIVHTPNEFRQ
jgi:hypothetical protein